MAADVVEFRRMLQRGPKPRIPRSKTKLCALVHYQNLTAFVLRSMIVRSADREIELYTSYRPFHFYSKLSVCVVVACIHSMCFWSGITHRPSCLIYRSKMSETLATGLSRT